MLKAPKFWYQPPGFYSALAQPLAWTYALAHHTKSKWSQGYKARIPVICVGNFTVGGSGKTPTVTALVRLLKQDQKKAIHILTRGYGGVIKTATQANLTQHHYQDVGDEALLLAQQAPTWVGGNRGCSAQAAEKSGAEILLMDDGAQNPSLHKDLCFMVIDGQNGLGNGCTLPAGPLREKLNVGLARTDAVILVGKDQHNLSRTLDRPIINAHIQPHPESIQNIKGKQLIAFAGIGLPEKFFATLEKYGGETLEKVPFPDHHPYRVEDLKPLVEKAKAQKALLVTTEKDFMRVPSMLQPSVTPFKIHLAFENPDDVLCHLSSVITL